MGKVGKLKVKLDKPYYIAGDAVTGTIFLQNKEEIELDKVFVKVKGKEKVQWTEHWTTLDGDGNSESHEKEYDEKEAFFKKKIKITGDDATLQPGKWAFPFEFQLPTKSKKGNKLSGSFRLTDGSHIDWAGRNRISDLKAKVEYSLKACVDLEGDKDLEKKIDMTIYEQLLDAYPMPRDQKSEHVMQCFCCDKGALTIEAMLDKNYYVAGETARAKCKIANSSTKEVKAVAELNRLIRMKADGNVIFERHMKKLGEFATVGPGETKEVDMEFQIPSTFPSTDGHYLDCAYVMDILAEIEMAPDIECHFPVNIFVPPMVFEQDVEDDTYVVSAPCVAEDEAMRMPRAP